MRLLGADNAADCAAGAFHDYWIAVSGLDQAKKPKDTILSPRLLCAKESGGYVKRLLVPGAARAAAGESDHVQADVIGSAAGSTASSSAAA